ncbi:MAG: tryptophan synthase subunit alpha [Deltaproteobacteria bacterium]|nr:tryptophan synthase subunit alpha [Deltaproteobacteria bacterium]
MNKIQNTLVQLKAEARKSPALMTHVVMGYPSLKESMAIVAEQARAGAQFVELQIPFSDPMADGPTIMKANQAALDKGIKVLDCFKAAEKLAGKVSTPLLFMTYFNIAYRYKGGVKAFCRDSANAGMSGLIIPDISIEDEVENYWSLALNYNLSPIPIASPITPKARLKKIAPLAKKGFVYCVSSTGTTGAKNTLPTGLGSYLDKVRQTVKSPVAVGFGISQPVHIKALTGHTDIAIVGSACIDIINKSKGNYLKAVTSFIASLCK